MMKRVAIICTVAALFLGTTSAHAIIDIRATEVGSDVVFSFSGSLSPSLGAFYDTALTSGGIEPFISFISFPNLVSGVDRYYADISGPASFGPGAFLQQSSSSGSAFRLSSIFVGVPHDYVSGTAISGSMTFASATLASLGITRGIYTWAVSYLDINTEAPTGGSDQIRLFVPEPGTLALLGLGLLGLGVTRRRAA